MSRTSRRLGSTCDKGLKSSDVQSWMARASHIRCCTYGYLIWHRPCNNLRRPNQHTEEHMQDDQLQAYFKFDEADLQANRDGQLSEKQKYRFAELDRSRRNGRVVAGIVFIGVAIAGLVGTLWLGVSVQNL